jgi:hypothetical protein
LGQAGKTLIKNIEKEIVATVNSTETIEIEKALDEIKLIQKTGKVKTSWQTYRNSEGFVNFKSLNPSASTRLENEIQGLVKEVEGGGSIVIGSGPVDGVLEVSNNVKSVAGFKNYNPTKNPLYNCKCIEYIYDTKQKIFLVGQPKNVAGFEGLSQHQQLQKIINASRENVVGGIFKRGENGEILTNESSGHFGENWNDNIRKEFVKFMEDLTGQTVKHEKW